MRRQRSVMALLALSLLALTGCTASVEDKAADDNALISFGLDSVPSSFNAKTVLASVSVEEAQKDYLKVTQTISDSISERFAALDFQVASKADQSPLPSASEKDTLAFSITTDTLSADWPSLDEATLYNIIDAVNVSAAQNGYEMFDAESSGVVPVTTDDAGNVFLDIFGKVSSSESAFWNVSAFYGLDADGNPYGSVRVSTTSAPHLKSGTEGKFTDMVRSEYDNLIATREK